MIYDTSRIEKIDIDSWHLFIDESGTKDYKRLTKLKEEKGWERFQPDSDPHHPNFFSLAGLLIRGNELLYSLIPSMRDVKTDLYSEPNVVLHFSDMLAAIGRFGMYKNKPDLFKSDLTYIVNKIKDVDFRVFIVNMNKVEMLNSYKIPANPYEFAPTVIMERIGGWFHSNTTAFGNDTSRKMVRVWFEAREKNDDKDLKNYMIDELKLPTETLFSKTNFPRYLASIKNVRSLEWHIHGLPKDPEDLTKKQYYKSKYETTVGMNLIHALHLVDIIVSAKRRLYENTIYPNPKIKYLEVEPLTDFMSGSGKIQYERNFP